MGAHNYKFSFTAAGALIVETVIIAQRQLNNKDWSITKKEVLDNNLLQKEKVSTAKRQYSEIEMRLKNLTLPELQLLAEGSNNEAKSMVWLSIVKTYSFIAEFVVEVILNQYLNREYSLTNSGYSIFWNYKKSISEDCANLSDTTVLKIKQVIFRMVEQLGIVDSTKSRCIINPMLSEKVEKVIVEDNPMLLSMFLYEEFQIKQTLSRFGS